MVEYDFSDYRKFKELFRDLYHKKLTIDVAEAYQFQFDAVLYNLNKYSPKNAKYIEAKNDLVKNEKKFTKGEIRLLKGLKIIYFRFITMKRR